MTKLNHGTIRYQRRTDPDVMPGYHVEYGAPGEMTPRQVGVVYTNGKRWYYRQNRKTDGVGPFATRAEAADHLVSANYPSAGWLGRPVTA